jgi:hypothetical protein
MKTIIKAAIAAFSLAAGASASQADVVWHFPYKGAPYTTRTETVTKADPVYMAQKANHSATMKRAKELAKKHQHVR